MARAWLKEDVRCAVTMPPTVRAGLDDECRCIALKCDSSSDVLPCVTIRRRELVEFDDDGNPCWSWTTVAENCPSIVWELRQEIDAVAGFTRLMVHAVIPYSGDVRIDEADVLHVTVGDGSHMVRLTSVAPFPTRLEIEGELVDGD